MFVKDKVRPDRESKPRPSKFTRLLAGNIFFSQQKFDRGNCERISHPPEIKREEEQRIEESRSENNPCLFRIKIALNGNPTCELSAHKTGVLPSKVIALTENTFVSH